MEKAALDNLCTDVKITLDSIFGQVTKIIILYGSYARGDYDNESDIDFAILLDLKREELSSYYDQLAEAMSDLDLKYEKVINFSPIPISDFEKFKEALPYYRNINGEGVRINA